MAQVLLASKSPRRHEILTAHGVPFRVIENKCLQEPSTSYYRSADAYVKACSYEKASASIDGHNGWILGADTMIEYRGQLIGKPISKSNAMDYLTLFSNDYHCVHTACCMIHSKTKQTIYCVDSATIHVGSLSINTIQKYLNNDQFMDQAGGYDLLTFKPYVKEIIGDEDTVRGLPIIKLLTIFKEYDIVK